MSTKQEPTKEKKSPAKKKVTRSAFYPYEHEAQQRVATALDELQKAYSVADAPLKKEIDTMFDYICNLQDKIEAQLDAEMAPTSMKALEAAAKEQQKAATAAKKAAEKAKAKEEEKNDASPEGEEATEVLDQRDAGSGDEG